MSILMSWVEKKPGNRKFRKESEKVCDNIIYYKIYLEPVPRPGKGEVNI